MALTRPQHKLYIIKMDVFMTAVKVRIRYVFSRQLYLKRNV